VLQSTSFFSMLKLCPLCEGAAHIYGAALQDGQQAEQTCVTKDERRSQ